LLLTTNNYTRTSLMQNTTS